MSTVSGPLPDPRVVHLWLGFQAGGGIQEKHIPRHPLPGPGACQRCGAQACVALSGN